MKPLVSVIIPVYNVKDFIEESVESICKQTYKNIEIILVDDGTKDNSIELAQNILSKNNKKAIIIHQKNAGLPAARNSGIRESNGEYICFIDSDDVIGENHIMYSIKSLLKTGTDVSYSDFEYTGESNRNGSVVSFKGYEYLNKAKLFRLFSDRIIKIHCCSLLIKKSILSDNSILFNERLKYGEDVEFMWRLFSVIDGIQHVRQNSYKYLIRDNSIMSSPSIDKWKVFINEFKKTIKKLIVQYPRYKRTYSFVYSRTILGLLHTVAKNTEWITFYMFTSDIDIKRIRRELLFHGNIKTKMVSISLLNLRLFYLAFHNR